MIASHLETPKNHQQLLFIVWSSNFAIEERKKEREREREREQKIDEQVHKDDADKQKRTTLDQNKMIVFTVLLCMFCCPSLWCEPIQWVLCLSQEMTNLGLIIFSNKIWRYLESGCCKLDFILFQHQYGHPINTSILARNNVLTSCSLI